MMVRIFSYYWSLACFVALSSCGIPTLNEQNKKQLVIASDFLDYRDTSLFSSFAKTFDAEIHILHMTNDSILSKIKKEGYSTRLDLVILRSSLDFCEYSEKGFLQPITDPLVRPDMPHFLKGKKKEWFGLAVDPFVIVRSANAQNNTLNYADLAKLSSWTTNLEENQDLTALFVALVHKYRKEGKVIEKLANSLFQVERKSVSLSDSSFQEGALLTRYSEFQTNSSLSRSYGQNPKIEFPNQNKGGIHYELRGAAVIRQARNYSTAAAFVNYFTEQKNNEKLNNRWNTIPLNQITERSLTHLNKRIRCYPVATHEFCAFRKEAIQLVSKTRRK